MPQFSRTWWGQRFIASLEEFTDPGRLGRGRSYASGGRVLSFAREGRTVTAKVRGSVNPYYGIYKEPIYTTSITMTAIPPDTWSTVIDSLTTKAGFVARLLTNEVPERIEDAFEAVGQRLLPHSRRDFTTSCSCPDSANPCKHIAGVYYLLASELDHDPFLLFELRGLSREQLHAELARSPLGQILASELNAPPIDLEPAQSYFTVPRREPLDIPAAELDHREFWTGARRLPPVTEPAAPPAVPAMLVKQQGDYPPFWPKDASFIATMEELYERVRSKSLGVK